MKIQNLFLLAVLLLTITVTFSNCSKREIKENTEQAADFVGDTGRDIKQGAEDAVDSIKDTGREIKHDAEDAADSVKDAVK